MHVPIPPHRLRVGGFAARLVTALAPLLLAACQPAAGPALVDTRAVEDSVRAASAAWDEAHNAGDVDRLMALYMETAVSMPYHRPALEGRTAIAADFGEFFSAFTARHQTTILSLVVAGEWAIERGRYEFSATPRSGGARLAETGKHVVVRRRVDGAWRIQWEIWNTDAPPVP